MQSKYNTHSHTILCRTVGFVALNTYSSTPSTKLVLREWFLPSNMLLRIVATWFLPSNVLVLVEVIWFLPSNVFNMIEMTWFLPSNILVLVEVIWLLLPYSILVSIEMSWFLPSNVLNTDISDMTCTFQYISSNRSNMISTL